MTSAAGTHRNEYPNSDPLPENDMAKADGTLTVGEFLFQHLYRTKGLKHAFGLPGDFALPLFHCIDQSPIELVTMTHEPGVGFAADAYARIHGLGLALVTYGVGGLNMVNSIGCAYAEKSPVIVVSGSPSMAERNGSALVHELTVVPENRTQTPQWVRSLT